MNPAFDLDRPHLRLAWDLARTLAAHFARDDASREALDLEMLALISDPRHRELLWRRDDDPRDRVIAGHRIRDEAISYFEMVITRPTEAARSRADALNVCHDLLRLWLARAPPAPTPHPVEIGRAHSHAQMTTPPTRALAETLVRIAEARTPGLSERAKNALASLGDVVVRKAGAAMRGPAELSLRDAIDAVDAAGRPTDAAIVADAQAQRALANVLSARNRRYAYLLTCALDPRDWHDSDKPSFQDLRELAQLKRRADEIARAGATRAAALAAAFAELALANGGKWAGFATRAAFAGSTIAAALARAPVISVEAWREMGRDLTDEEGGEGGKSAVARAEDRAQLTAFAARHRALLPGPRERLFVEVMLGERDFDELLRELGFRDEIAAEPALANLATQTIYDRLWADIAAAMPQLQRRIDDENREGDDAA